MEITFYSQPFSGGKDLRDFLELTREDTDLTDLTVVVAWAKRSGLGRVRDVLMDFRERAGVSKAIIGISEGGATRQGLELAFEMFDEVYIFYDKASTFHPKIYFARGADSARLFVGSNNLTKGGLYSNYEAALGIALVMSEERDQLLANEIDEYVASLISDEEVCKLLNQEFLNELLADSRLRIGDEDHRHSATVDNSPVTEDDDTDNYEPGELLSAAIFGSSTKGKRSGPNLPADLSGGSAPAQGGSPSGAPTASPVPKATATSALRAVTPPPPSSPAPLSPTIPAPLVLVSKRWFKTMSNSDAQHAGGPGTQITGNLKLTRALHAIDQTIYFRYDFFASSAWVGAPSPRGVLETCFVMFDVNVHGISHGTMRLKVDHADYRIAGQSNVATWLHWGPLQPLLTAANYSGDVVTLELLASGAYALTIDNVPTGPFVP